MQTHVSSTSANLYTISNIAASVYSGYQEYHIVIEYRYPPDSSTAREDKWLGTHDDPPLNRQEDMPVLVPSENGISVFLHTNQNEPISYTIEYLSNAAGNSDDIYAVRLSFWLKEDLARMKLIYSTSTSGRRKPNSDEIKLIFRRGSSTQFTNLYTPTIIEINNASGYGPSDDASRELYQTWLPLSPAVIDLLGFFRYIDQRVSGFQTSIIDIDQRVSGFQTSMEISGDLTVIRRGEEFNAFETHLQLKANQIYHVTDLRNYGQAALDYNLHTFPLHLQTYNDGENLRELFKVSAPAGDATLKGSIVGKSFIPDAQVSSVGQ